MKICRNVSTNLSTTETLGLLGLLGLLHRCVCAECRTARRTADPIVARAVQQMRQTDVPPDGAARTLAMLHTLAPETAFAPNASSRPIGQRVRVGRLIGGAASLAAAVVIFLLVLPFLSVRKSLAAEVQAALSAVNSWHLSGWKMMDGKRVRWEVWGRRTPFFYREQVGNQIIWDDGKVRYQIFAADTMLGRPVGLALKTASRPDESSLGWNWIHSFATWNRNSKPWKETQNQLLFMNHDSGMQGPDTLTDNIYTIDRSTMLLSQVTIRRGKVNSPARTTAQQLQASYDVPLPFPITALQLPKGIITVDTTVDARGGAANQNALPRKNALKTVSQNGLTVQATPLAVDSTGCVLIRLRAWLGNTELKMDGKPFVWGASAVRSEGIPAVDPPACYDETGRAYLSVSSELLRFADPNQGILMFLAPLEPLPDGAAPPQHLTLLLEVNPQMTIRLSAKEVSSSSLMIEKVPFNLSLPLPGPAINIESYTSEERRLRSPNLEPFSLPSDTAYARANFYRDRYSFEGRVQSKNKTSRSYWKASQAARWGEEAVALAPAHSNKAQFLRLDLANNYGWLSNPAREEAVLQEVIVESDRFPNLDPDYRRMAERILRRKTASQTRRPGSKAVK